MNLISNILVYPSSLADTRQDCRCPWNEPFMLVCFDHVREESEMAIINDFVDFEDMEVIPVSMRDILEMKTTWFEPKTSLS